MNIDETTGLPELPEPDLFWRVKPNAVEIWRNLPGTEWRNDEYNYPSLDFSRIEYLQEDRETEYRTINRTWTTTEKRWFRRVKVEKSDTYKALFARRVNRRHREITVLTKKTGETETIPGTWISGYSYSRYGYHPGHRTPDRTYDVLEPVTKETLQGLCIDALKAYADAQLVGDYPPKKLEQNL